METKVRLKDVKFHGFHGLHQEEKKTGNIFTVNLEVVFNLTDPNNLAKGVDYVELFKLTKNIMDKPQDLLESVASDILTDVKTAFSFINEATITITKEKPPIPFFQGNTEIEIKKVY